MQKHSARAVQNIVRGPCKNIGSDSKERSGLVPCARLERCEDRRDREDREARERSRSCYVLERALEDARVETLRRRDRALGVGCTYAVSASGLGRLAELQYAAREGFAVWSCVPRWLRAAIHGNDGNHGPYGDATVTTRDRGVDVVGLRDGRLVLAQVKWYREGACVSGDADMKLALIGATTQRGCADMGLLAPPVTVLVVRRGARTARSSPGTETIEYVELTDADLGLDGPRGPLGLSGLGGDTGLSARLCGPGSAEPCQAGAEIDPCVNYECDSRTVASSCTDKAACPFEAYRYRRERSKECLR